ncbi:hypothetical protein ACIQVL_45560 [Streptomyces sp. NPDC090499]|uniref:hypothetical protein n=1 Tax=unclassified Streptomyces TaxID=2593676 RepID=UPI0037F177B5
MNCPSSNCGSSNVQLLSLYVDGLPVGAPNRERFARPAPSARNLLPALGLVVLGVLLLVSGEILAGVLFLGAGAVWGLVAHRLNQEVERARSKWENTRICLACTERWTP